MPLKPVLGGVRDVFLMNRLNPTEPAVFQFCRFSLFPKDLLFRLFAYC